jgi:Family of unknown function (DUF6084)
MAGPGPLAIDAPGSVPEPAFAVRGAQRVPYTAAPTLGFALEITCPGGQAIRSILLDTQIQIAAARRAYDDASHERLFELFGPPEGWGRALHTLLWTRITRVVPPFTGSTVITLEVPCSYDLEVAASRYFDALGDDGAVPLEFLFSGTLFYGGAEGQLQTARISWEQEALTRLPVATWRATMDQHFPGSAWLRLGKERFDRLAAYRSRHALSTWDDVLDALMAGED